MENKSEKPNFQPLLQYPGYRIGTDGTVESEWRFRGNGRGNPPTWYQSGEWRVIKHSVDTRGRHTVRLRASYGVYRRIKINRLLAEAVL